MARLGSWDPTAYPPTWFDVDNDTGGQFDRDAIPMPKPVPPGPVVAAPTSGADVRLAWEEELLERRIRDLEGDRDPRTPFTEIMGRLEALQARAHAGARSAEKGIDVAKDEKVVLLLPTGDEGAWIAAPASGWLLRAGAARMVLAAEDGTLWVLENVDGPLDPKGRYVVRGSILGVLAKT